MVANFPYLLSWQNQTFLKYFFSGRYLRLLWKDRVELIIFTPFYIFCSVPQGVLQIIVYWETCSCFFYILWSQACLNLLFNKLSCRTLLKRCTSRWDQETPRKIQKIEKLVRNPLPLYSFQFDTECNSLSGDQFKTDDGLDENKIKLSQTETRNAALCEESVISCGINTFEGGNEAVSSGCSCQINLDVNKQKTSSTLPEIGQDPTYTKTHLENNKEIEDTGKHLSGEFEVTCERTRYHVDHNLFYLYFK